MNFKSIYEASNNNPYGNYPAGVSASDFDQPEYPTDKVNDAVEYYSKDIVDAIQQMGVTELKDAVFLASDLTEAIESAIETDSNFYADTAINDAFLWVWTSPEEIAKYESRIEQYKAEGKRYSESDLRLMKNIVTKNEEFRKYETAVFDENGEFKNSDACDDLMGILETAFDEGKNALN
jgi:hypothetical protein